jgi:hypothetical protein
MQSHRHCLPLLLATLLWAQVPALARDGDLSVTFMATPTKLPKEVGHAFLCVTVGTAGGGKEDCFGFYPQSNVDVMNGKGKIERELSRKEKPERFSTVVTSVTVPISVEKRQMIYSELERWGGKDYKLLSNNCGDMVFAIAKVAGIPLPSRSSVLTPADFVNGLKVSLDYQASVEASKRAEDDKRKKDAAARQLQQRQLESAQRTVQQLEQARKQQEQIEAARRIAEQADAARRAAEQAETARRAAEQAEAVRKAREMAEAAERARKQAEQVEQARKAIEAAQRVREVVPVIRP